MFCFKWIICFEWFSWFPLCKIQFIILIILLLFRRLRWYTFFLLFLNKKLWTMTQIFFEMSESTLKNHRLVFELKILFFCSITQNCVSMHVLHRQKLTFCTLNRLEKTQWILYLVYELKKRHDVHHMLAILKLLQKILIIWNQTPNTYLLV